MAITLPNFRGIFERGRTVPAGIWSDVSYSNTNFSTSGSMTWTVEAGDIGAYQWMEIGKTMWVNFVCSYASIGGTPSTNVKVKVPNSRTISKLFDAAGRGYDAGNGWQTLHVEGAASDTWITVGQNNPAANWTACTNGMHVRFQCFFEFA